MNNLFGYILKFGLIIGLILIILKLSKYSVVTVYGNYELIIGIIALVFLLIGFMISRKYFYKENEVIREVLINGEKNLDSDRIKEIGLSKREYEVLELVSKGLTNKEIGEKLFLSESTIKTHVSNIFVKLDAKRRTEAIRIAKEQNIIN